MSQINEVELKAGLKLFASTKLVLNYYLEKGAKVKDVSTESSNITIILSYKNIDLWLKQEFSALVTPLNSFFGQSIADNKYATYNVFKMFGLLTPQTILYDKQDPALLKKTLAKHKKLTVKPISEKNGKGISLAIGDLNMLNQALKQSNKFGSGTIIQPYIQGNDYRLLFVNYRLVAAFKRLAPYVIGDGVSNIGTLIEFTNSNKKVTLARSKSADSYKKANLSPLHVTQNYGKAFLKKVPAAGQKIKLLNTTNLRSGAFSQDATDHINPGIDKKFSELLRYLGLRSCGIDVISQDISAPLSQQKTYLIELNSRPGLLHHLKPDFGRPRPVTKIVAEAIYTKQKALNVKAKSGKI